MKSRRHDISTTYLGMHLRSPLIPSASPLSQNIAALEEMERRGAGAVVFYSLFEEQLGGNPAPRKEYCDQITAAKKKLSIPVIGSLSARSPSGWADMAYAIEQAGADALELNVFETRLSTTVPPGAIEAIYIETVQTVVAAVRIPVSVKLPPLFTNLA